MEMEKYHNGMEIAQNYAEGLAMPAHKVIYVSTVPGYFLSYIKGKYHLSETTINIAKRIFIATLNMKYRNRGKIEFATPEAEKWWNEILTFENTEVTPITQWQAEEKVEFKSIVTETFPKPIFKIDEDVEEDYDSDDLT